MRNTAYIFLIALLPAVAVASETMEKKATETAPAQTSRALKIAKRVADNENHGDLLSRAVWLSQRVIKNSKAIAYQQKPVSGTKAKKRQVNPQKN